MSERRAYLHKGVGETVGVGDRHIEQGVITGLVEVGLQEHRQPDAVVGVRDLVDVLQLGTFDQQDAVRHRPRGLLLRERVQERRARDVGTQETHAHVVLQVIARLRIGGQAVDVAVIEDLPRQPVVGERVQPRIRRFDAQAARAGLDVRGAGAPGFAETVR